MSIIDSQTVRPSAGYDPLANIEAAGVFVRGLPGTEPATA